jgi:hypothetical protein
MIFIFLRLSFIVQKRRQHDKLRVVLTGRVWPKWSVRKKIP